MPFDLEMAMCSGSVDRGISVEQPLDVAYARNAAHGGQQLFELFLVAHVDGHFDDTAIVIGLGLGFEAADVGILAGEHAGELIEHAGTIVGVDHDADGKGVRGGAGPFDFDLALHVVEQALDIGAHTGMHGDAFAAGHVAHDGLAADRIAALGAVDHEVVEAPDPDDAVPIGAFGAGRGIGGGAIGNGSRPGLGDLLLDDAGSDFGEHLAGGELAVAEGGVQVFHLAEPVLSGHALHVGLGHLAKLDAQAAGFLFQVFLADFDGLHALAGVDQVLDLVARARSLDEGQPVFAGLMAGLGHDLDDVAVAQNGAQRHDAAVDLGAHAGAAHIGVNGVREIDGRGVARQHDHFAARREGVGLLGVQVHFEGGHEFSGILHVALPFHQMAQPGDALVVGGGAFSPFLVFPVGRDAFLGDAMHLLGADLDLEGLPVRADHAGVERLVEIGPRNGNEILNASGDGAPLIVDHTERRVAVLDRVGEDAQRHEIVDLVERDLLAAHFLEDGEGPLEAAIDTRGDAFAAQLAFHGLADFAEELLVGVALGFNGAEDLLVGIRLQVLEGQILEFAADLAHAETVRDRGIDLDGFARDALAPLRAEITQGAHVVDAVGQFDQDDADILDHGEQHLADAFGLPVFGGENIELGEFGDAIDATGHLGAELLAHLIDGDAGVLHDIVEQTGFHGHHVHAHVGEDVRHHDGMDHVGFAGIAGLAFVIFAGEAEGFLERGEIVLGAVLADLDFQFGVQLLDRVGRRRYWPGFGQTGGLGGHANPIVAGDPKKRTGSGSDEDRLP